MNKKAEDAVAVRKNDYADGHCVYERNGNLTYKNAKDILPEELLREIQRYTDGEAIYIPAKQEKRSAWGDRSGARRQYDERNRLIRTMYSESMSAEELADRFYLSVDSIRKIIRN